MTFYSYFRVQGRGALTTAFASADPFALSPKEVIRYVIAAGYHPGIGKTESEMWPAVGTIHQVSLNGQIFLVGLSRDAEEISVQEFRTESHPVE